MIVPDPSPLGFESDCPTILISKLKLDGTIATGLLSESLSELAGQSEEQAIPRNKDKIVILRLLFIFKFKD